VAFTPYLYHPTVAGLPAVRERAILHPAAHDEPAIRLPLFEGVFEAARGLAFYTEGERAITEELFPSAVAKPQVVVGLGIDPPPAASAGHGIAALESRPYLLVLGRVDHSKGTHLLASFFARYKQRRPGSLALAVVGPVQRPVPVHPDIVQVGEVDDAAKWALLRGAAALVSPSAFESFSLVLFEAWEAGRPVLVNARCSATLEHVNRSGGGLAFETYAVFEAALDRLLLDESLQRSLASAGARYAVQYRWPVVIDRYRRFAERLASTLPASTLPASTLPASTLPADA
jgi:glycosyltransferase involved in cell wall biosynthesis